MEFDASEQNVLKVPDSAELDFAEEFTLEAWVRPSTANHYWQPIIDKQFGEGKGKYKFAYWLYASEGEEKPYGGTESNSEEGDVIGPEPLAKNAWSHVALTYDGNHIRLYVDGELVDTDTGPPPQITAGDLQIGGSTEHGDYFDGRIDEVRLYNRALDAGEVGGDKAAPLQTPQQAPIAAYSFDEGEGETVEDLTGNGHAGTIEGADWTTHGRYGGALEFDRGAHDFVKVPDSPELDFEEEFTLEAWVRPSTAYNKWAPILVKQTGGEKGPSSFSYRLYDGNWEQNHPLGAVESVLEEEDFSVNSPEALPEKAWSHVALTFDGAKLRLYVDGELVDENTADAPVTTAGDLEIGGSDEHNDYFDGRIDEVRIYNRALEQTEVRQTMNSTFPVAVTGTGEEVESNDAIMTGIAEVNGGEAEYFFEYGPTTSYGSVATGEELQGNGETVKVEEVAVNLVPETTYHYRLVAEGPIGTAYGKDKALTTGERTMTVEEEEKEASAEEAPLTEPLAKSEPANFFGMMWTGNIPQMVKAHGFDAIENSGAKMVRFVAAPGADVSDAFNEARSHNLTALPYLGSGGLS